MVSNTPSNKAILRSMGPKRDSRLLRVNFSGNETASNGTNNVSNPAISTVEPSSNMVDTPSKHVNANNLSTVNSEHRLQIINLDKTITNGLLGGNPEHSNEKPNIEGITDFNSFNNSNRTNRNALRKSNSAKMEGTVISKGSVSESIVTDLLRKGVAASGAKLEKSLTTLRTSIIAVFLIIAGLNLISLVITSVLFADLKRNLLLVSMSGDRALEMNRAIGRIQSLVFSAEKKVHIPEGSGYIRNKLALTVDNLEIIHRELYLSLNNGALTEEIRLYTQPVIKMYDLIPGTYVNRTLWQAKERNVGLVNAVLEFISKIRSIQALADENITHNRAPVWFVMQNGMSGLHQAINESLMYADKRTRGHVDNIELTNLVVMIIAESILGIIVLVVMIPAVNSVSRTKQHVFDTFLEVPVGIIRALRNRVQKKLEAILRSENEEDHEIDIDNGGSDDGTEIPTSEFGGIDKERGQGNNGNTTPRLPGSGNGSVASTDSSLNRAIQAYHAKMQHTLSGVAEHSDEHFEEEQTCCRCCRCCVRTSNPKSLLPSTVSDIHKRRRRTFRNTRSSRVTVLLLMILPLLCYVVYFAAVYDWRHMESVSIRNIKAEMLWTKQAEFYTGLNNIYLRDAVGYCDPDFVERSLNLTTSSSNYLEFLQNGLLYGYDDMLLRPGIHLSTDIYNLAMVDGCFEPNNDAYNLSSCEKTFYDGIFGKGFQQGFREYLYLNREVIQGARDSLLMDPALSTTCKEYQSLDSNILKNIDEMRWRYLLAGLAEFTKIRLDLSDSLFDNFIAANIAITILTILALQIIFSVLYKPMIRSMDKEIKNVRLLLLLFPDEVSRQVPAIIAAGKELLSDSASVSSGSSA